jgi:hypothetical protein
MANALANERSVVKWQAGRQDKSNAGWLYVANIGEDTAYEVSLIAWDGHERVSVKADTVPPRLLNEHAESDPPGYIDFRLSLREENGPTATQAASMRLVMPPEGSAYREEFEAQQRELEEIMDRQQRQQVVVRITWRSELGRWSTETLQTG